MTREIKISVITVCYNAEKVIEETIQSVLAQDYHNIEYIIVDGLSKDATMDIVMQYASEDKIKWISEMDKGIYDAMNKGIAMASGDYVQFLNAGDVFVDSYIVSKVAAGISDADADIIYGHILYRYPDGSVKQRNYTQFCATKLYYLLGDCINHQAIFSKRECLKQRFDITYVICADREWMLRVKKQGCKFKAIDQVICRYSLDEESVSVKNHELYKQEADRCIKQHLRGGYWLFALVNRIREGKLSAKILHGIYKLAFINNGRS